MLGFSEIPSSRFTNISWLQETSVLLQAQLIASAEMPFITSPVKKFFNLFGEGPSTSEAIIPLMNGSEY